MPAIWDACVSAAYSEPRQLAFRLVPFRGQLGRLQVVEIGFARLPKLFVDDAAIEMNPGGFIGTKRSSLVKRRDGILPTFLCSQYITTIGMGLAQGRLLNDG